MIQCETFKAMIDHTAIPDLDISSPRSLPHLSLPISDDSQLPRPHETGDEDEDEEVVLVNDLHDVLLDFATTSPDMACFTISSAINNSGLPTAFSLEELSPDLSAACFPVNGRSKSFGNSVSKVFTDAVSKLEMGHDSRNKQFHKLFPCVPDTEPVINSYSCALVKDILLQGRLFVSENWLCFHSNIFMYEKQIALRFETISRITKERTAFVVPNAIGIHTDTEKHIFGSLLSRHSTYQLLYRVWKNAKGETESMTPDSSQQGESDGDDIPDNCDESSQSDDGLDGNANEIQNGSMLSSVGAHQRRESPRRSDLRSDLSSSHHSSPRQLRLTSDLPHSMADLAGRSRCSRFSHRHLAHMLCSVSIFKSIMRMGGALKRLPQYQPFLLLIGILLLCLTFSAAVLTIRIWRLQPHTTALPQTSPHESVHLESMGNMGDLFIAEQHKHQQKVSHIQDTLTANLQALLQVQSSLSSLHKRPQGDPGGGEGGGGGTEAPGRVSEVNPPPSTSPQKGLREDL